MSITFMRNVGTIRTHAFYKSGYNANTMSITFMGNVDSIMDQAFQYSGVVSITYNGNLPSLCNNVFKCLNHLFQITFIKLI
jgi:hypothetical protein